MSEFKKHIDERTGSDKGFGLVFTFVFLLVGLYPVIKSGELRLWAIIVSIVFFGLACFAPRLLSIPNKLWFRLSIVIGGIVTPIVMAIIYFIAVVPTGILLKLIKNDLLQNKLDKRAKSYWI